MPNRRSLSARLVPLLALVIGGVAGLGAAPAADGTPEIEGNHITGALSCATSTPAPTNDNLHNTTGGAKLRQCANL